MGQRPAHPPEEDPDGGAEASLAVEAPLPLPPGPLPVSTLMPRVVRASICFKQTLNFRFTGKL